MNVEDLIVGVHVSSQEMSYLKKTVIPGIRANGYKGPIEVVGSRADGHRVSAKVFEARCQDMPEPEQIKWRTRLDELVQVNDIPAGEIRTRVPKLLPPETPTEVRRIFESQVPDADLDLLIKSDDNKVPSMYEDKLPPKGSGLVVEIFTPDDHSWAKLSSTSY